MKNITVYKGEELALTCLKLSLKMRVVKNCECLHEDFLVSGKDWAGETCTRWLSSREKGEWYR